MQIDSNALFVRQPDVVACELGTGMALLNMQEGKYYRLNDTAKLIWDQLEEPSNVASLVDSIVNRFEISVADCTGDVVAVVTKLCEDNLVRQFSA
jgi:hypothetical protein